MASSALEISAFGSAVADNGREAIPTPVSAPAAMSCRRTRLNRAVGWNVFVVIFLVPFCLMSAILCIMKPNGYGWRLEPHRQPIPARDGGLDRWNIRSDRTPSSAEIHLALETPARTSRECGWIGCPDGLLRYAERQGIE